MILALILVSAALAQQPVIITACPPGRAPGAAECKTASVVVVKRTSVYALAPQVITVEEGGSAEFSVSTNQPVPGAIYKNGFPVTMAYQPGCTGPSVVTVPVGASTATATVACAAPVVLAPIGYTIQGPTGPAQAFAELRVR